MLAIMTRFQEELGVWFRRLLPLAILGLTALAFITRHEVWPVTYYPMFSQRQQWKNQVSYEFRYVTAEGEIKMPKEEYNPFIHTSNQARTWMVNKIKRRRSLDSPEIKKFLWSLVVNAPRRKELHLQGVRLYETTWRPRSSSHDFQLVSETLLAEAVEK
jgi:hypothetical protein